MPTSILNMSELSHTHITTPNSDEILLQQPAPYGLRIIYPSLPIPAYIGEFGAVYFYFGWEDYEGGWLVRRQVRASGAVEDASGAGNPAYSNFASAWAAQTSLTYGV